MYKHEVLKTVKTDVENTMAQSLNMAEKMLDWQNSEVESRTKMTIPHYLASQNIFISKILAQCMKNLRHT